MTADVSEAAYWQQRYAEGVTGWDTGSITTPLLEYFQTLQNKDLKILIPGAGNSYEAEWLHNNGFRNVFVLDFAAAPLAHIAERVKGFPATHLLQEDFFNHKGQYDLIIEQTFFCAIDPSRRAAYSQTMQQLLRPKGKLAGLLFNCQFEGGPPFGGDAASYRQLFAARFNVLKLEPCYNSIPPRAGRELFVVMEPLPV